MFLVPVERDVLADVAVEVVLDLAAAKLLLEGGLRGGVEHLAADARGVGRPADEDPSEGGSVLLVQPERERKRKSWLLSNSHANYVGLIESLPLCAWAPPFQRGAQVGVSGGRGDWLDWG